MRGQLCYGEGCTATDGADETPHGKMVSHNTSVISQQAPWFHRKPLNLNRLPTGETVKPIAHNAEKVLHPPFTAMAN